MTFPAVSLLLVTYNGADDVERCLGSIQADTAIEILVRDNGSTDGTPEVIRDTHPEVVVDADGANLGFARAVNRLAAQARGDWLLLLNPDTEMHPGTVDRLVEHLSRNPGIGLLGGRTVTPEGVVDPSSCWGQPSTWSLVCFATGLSTAFRRHRLFDPESLGGWQRDSEREVGIVTGCLMLVSRNVWSELGGFDESFWLYGEDADLSLRARDLGYRPSIIPTATITHAVGGSSSTHGSKMVLVMRGKTTFLRKHWTGARRWAGLALLLGGTALRAALERAAGRSRESTWRTVWRQRAVWYPGY